MRDFKNDYPLFEEIILSILNRQANPLLLMKNRVWIENKEDEKKIAFSCVDRAGVKKSSEMNFECFEELHITYREGFLWPICRVDFKVNGEKNLWSIHVSSDCMFFVERIPDKEWFKNCLEEFNEWFPERAKNVDDEIRKWEMGK